MVLLGVSLLIKPEIVFGFIENNTENTLLYIFAIVVRLALGVLFIVAARESKYPGIIKLIGYLFIIAAVLFIFISQENFQDFIGSIIPIVKPFARVSSLLAFAFGGFLIYAFSEDKELKQK